MAREPGDVHSPLGLGFGEGGHEVGSTLPAVREPGHATSRCQGVGQPFPLGGDLPGGREGVVRPKVLNVDGHLGPEGAGNLAQDGSGGASGGQDD